jgi:hypothetical protein
VAWLGSAGAQLRRFIQGEKTISHLQHQPRSNVSIPHAAAAFRALWVTSVFSELALCSAQIPGQGTSVPRAPPGLKTRPEAHWAGCFMQLAPCSCALSVPWGRALQWESVYLPIPPSA